MTAPSRPVLRWHGGKWKLAPWIIERMPQHLVYVEPFGGAASVLLRKKPAVTEVWNDLNGEVVNLFRILRERPDELAQLLLLTPFSRAEYHLLYEHTDDALEGARRLVGRSFMGMGSKGALRKSGFDSRINPDGFTSRLNALRDLPNEIGRIVQRFQHVVIESRPALSVIRQYDRPDALIYCDPPYMPETRVAKHYAHEMNRRDHHRLLALLRRCRGMVMLSGYSTPLYEKRLAGWTRVETDALADNGKKTVEVLWLNPACAQALEGERMPLFSSPVQLGAFA